MSRYSEHPVFRALRIWQGYTGVWYWRIDDPNGRWRHYSHLSGDGFASRADAKANATQQLTRTIEFREVRFP